MKTNTVPGNTCVFELAKTKGTHTYEHFAKINWSKGTIFPSLQYYFYI